MVRVSRFLSLENNQKAFLELISAGLWEKKAQLLPFDSIDFSQVLTLAEEQAVVGLVAAGLEYVVDVKVPKESILQFVGQTLQLEQQNQAMNDFIGMLIDKMRKAGIYTLMVKGQGLAQCYEKPLWRACGDVDFFMSDDNYAKAKAFLIPLASGLEKEYVREKHLGMTIDEWVVELHGRLYCGLSSKIERELDKVHHDTFWGGAVRSWDNNGVKVFLLKAENDVFYVFTHILQHFYKGGIGLRQVCDWCRLLWTYRNKMDMVKLEERILRAGLVSEWKSFGAFAVDYLGMPVEAMPLFSSDSKWKRKAKRICAFILEVGNFGHNRDSSYFEKYPYLIRKIISFGRRLLDLYRHARIFPIDSIRFLPSMLINGVRSAIRGE